MALTRTLLRFVDAFSGQKPGIWGEPLWYVSLAVACGALALTLLVNAILTAFEGTREAAHKRHAPLLIGLTLIGGLFYSSVTPPWQAPDEHAHYEYAALMGELGRVPTLADVRQDIQAEVTASMFSFDFWRLIKRQPVDSPPVGFYRAGDLTEYPPTHVINDRYIYYPQVGNETPIYYVLPALLYKLSAGHDATYRLYLMRIASVAFWVSLAAATWWASRMSFPDRPRLALAALTVVVFNPMLNHIGTVLSNDILTAVWSTLALGILAVIFRKGVIWHRMVALLVVVTLAILTKKSSLWLAPTVVFAFLLLPDVPHRWRVGLGLSLGGLAAAALVLLVWPTGRARFWQGGTRVAEGGAVGNHVLSVKAGERTSQRVGHRRTFQVRGKTVILRARVRSSGSSQVKACLRTGAGTARCQGLKAEAEWQSVSVQFRVPDQAERLALSLNGRSPADLQFDDVSVAPQEGANLLRNSSMESGVSRLEQFLVILGQPIGIGDLIEGLFANFGVQARHVAERVPRAWRLLFDSFWGNFGAALTVPLKEPWPLLTRIGVVLAALGWGVDGARRTTTWHSWQKRVFVALGLGLVLALGQTFLRLFAQRGGWMPQGRFLFPAIWPIGTLLAIGWRGWVLKRSERWFLLCVTLGTGALYLGGIWRLISYFHQ